MAGPGLETVMVKDAAELRRWFEKNHANHGSVWLVINRKGTVGPGVSYEEAVEEALCFGWIDGRLNPLDENAYKLMFSPRKKGGTWAKSNKARVERLIAEGRMTPAGLARIEEAKADGSWDGLEAFESMEAPGDLARALMGDRVALETFEGWSDSYKRRVFYWIESAKREKTRSDRIARVMEAAVAGRRPFD